METAILQLILVGAQIFQEERKRYYQNKAKSLLKIISDVEDIDFYKKDMEAKGRAQRDILINTDELQKEFLLEAAK